MKSDEPRAKEHLGRLAGTAHIKPEHVAIPTDAGKWLSQPELSGLAWPQFKKATGHLGEVVAGVDRPFGALHEESNSHGLGSGVVVLHRHAEVDRILHDRPEIIDLKRRRLGVQDQLRFCRVPNVRIETVEERPVAADTSHKPRSQHSAIGGWNLDAWLTVRVVPRVVAKLEAREWDGKLNNPPVAIQLRSDHRITFPFEVGPPLLRPMPIRVRVDGVDIPTEEAELEALGQIGRRTKLHLQFVIPENPVERMHEHIRKTSAGLEPRVHRKDWR